MLQNKLRTPFVPVSLSYPVYADTLLCARCAGSSLTQSPKLGIRAGRVGLLKQLGRFHTKRLLLRMVGPAVIAV